MFYGTAASFLAYHTARGRDVSEYDDAKVEAALLVASEWLDATWFPPHWPYYKTGGSSQTRVWPALNVMDRWGYAVASDVVPNRVENATYEAAMRELQSPGALTKDHTPSKYKRVAIAGSVSVDYFDRDAQAVQTQFPIIGQILDPLMGSWSGMSSLSGAVARA